MVYKHPEDQKANPGEKGTSWRKLSLVAPFYNESHSASHFAALLSAFEKQAAERFGLSLEVILVDDGSTDDGAHDFAAALSGDWKIVRLSRNFGKEVALLAGVDHATGDLVMLMDADLQHSLETALTMVGELVADPEAKRGACGAQ